MLDGIRLVSNMFEIGKLFIHISCKNLIKELYAYRWDEKAALRGKEQPIKEADHAVDTLRYFCKTIVKPAHLKE